MELAFPPEIAFGHGLSAWSLSPSMGIRWRPKSGFDRLFGVDIEGAGEAGFAAAIARR